MQNLKENKSLPGFFLGCSGSTIIIINIAQTVAFSSGWWKHESSDVTQGPTYTVEVFRHQA